MSPECLRFIKEAGLKGRIVDVGSYNVNGAAREVVNVECGIDFRPGPGVDLVCAAEDMGQHFSAESLDSVICANTLEHVEKWRESLTAMWTCLKPGGKLMISLPTHGKGFHGHPHDYWRWTFVNFKKIFAGQVITKEVADIGKHFAIVVQKVNNDLDLSIEPDPVLPKDKRAKQKVDKHNRRQTT